MYTDLITYCSDTTALLTEVEAKFPDKVVRDDAGNAIAWAITKTPTVRNGSETLSVIRVNDAELADIKTLTSLKILAEVPAGGDLLGAMASADRAIYDSVYSRTPVDITAADGNVIGQQTPPELIGMFA